MRLATLSIDGHETPCLRKGDRYVPLAALVSDAPPNIPALLEAGPAALARLAAAAEDGATGVPVAGATYLPVIPKPGKIICLGLNFRDHAAEGGFAVPDYPAVFMRTTTSIIAHGAPLIRPLASERFDYEVELAVIVGTRTRHIAEASALSAVAGYSVFNDGSIRDYQRRTPQWTIGKNFDGTGPFGPELVTSDELPLGAKGLRITSRVNGQTLQDSSTDDMIFDVARTIALMSECMTLEPGDVIIMGTPAGVGHARKPPLWMRAGDTCECEIEGIGILSNPVEDERANAQAA